jgi:hypothetical protein
VNLVVQIHVHGGGPTIRLPAVTFTAPLPGIVAIPVGSVLHRAASRRSICLSAPLMNPSVRVQQYGAADYKAQTDGRIWPDTQSI